MIVVVVVMIFHWLSPREQEDVKRKIYILEYKRVRATGQKNDWISRWTVCHLQPFISFGYTLPSTQLCPLASLILHVLPLPLTTYTYIAKLLQNLSHYGINSIASTLPWFLPNSLSHWILPPLCVLHWLPCPAEIRDSFETFIHCVGPKGKVRCNVDSWCVTSSFASFAGVSCTYFSVIRFLFST